MQWTHESVCEILDVGELFVTVVDQQSPGEDSQNQQAEVPSDGTRKNGADQRLATTPYNLKKFDEDVRQRPAPTH